MAEKKRKAEKRRLFHLNIGTMIFGALFIYLVLSLFFYLTAKHIKSYQVVQGPLSRNETFTAFAMREEKVVKATGSGYVHYYIRNASKVSVGGVVYGLSDSAGTNSKAQETDETVLSAVRASLSLYSRAYDSDRFSDIYNFKYDLSQDLVGNVSASDTYGNQTLSRSDSDGVVVYQVDGYEENTPDTLTPELFGGRNKESMASADGQVKAGDPVYKLVTSETWKIALPLTARQMVKLSNYKNIKVKFLKDGATQNGSLELKAAEDQYYAVITFQAGMVRYAQDRFLKVELVTNAGIGLKIPNSAVIQKVFYVIPSEMTVNGGDSKRKGFLRIRKDSKGNVINDKNGQPRTEFVNPVLFAKDRNEKGEIVNYYVDGDSLSPGDILVGNDSLTQYTVEENEILDGVYCINKGYAVFRRISILDQNEEYCIVASKLDYGIALFDYIVEDASAVNEADIMQ